MTDDEPRAGNGTSRQAKRPVSGRVIGLVCGWLLAALIAAVHETAAERYTGQMDTSEGLTYLLPLVIVGFLIGWLIDSSRVRPNIGG